MRKKILTLMFIVFLVIIASARVISFPKIAAEFYGTATINWTNAPAGSNITAYDPDGVLCGYFIVSNKGYYGSLSCEGDDEETTTDEGAELNNNITFYVNNERAVMFGNTSWQSGAFKEVDVCAQNYAPYFEHNLTHQYIYESSEWLYDINCSDLNYWDNLTYYDNTSFFNISLTTGVINWTPLNEHVGNHFIKIICSDGRLNTSEVLNITVYDVNNPPVLSPIGNQIAVEGGLFTYNVIATDPDEDNLTYSADTTIFTINPYSGLISFTPTLANVGNHTINISVSDGLLIDYEVIHFRIVRGPYCGDGSCGINENCLNCPEDCGPCPEVPTRPARVGREGVEGEAEYEWRIYPRVCHERWECAKWSECSPDGYQTRRCIDINKCGTTKNKPEETMECVYIGTCFDGIQNCHDGLCEEGIDCGGPCSPCPVPPSCFDGIQNQGEEDIDCGGPCEPCEIKKYAKIPWPEEPIQIVKYPWFLLVLASAIISLTTLGDRIYIRKITKKELKEYRKSMLKYRKRRHKIYAMAMSVSSVILVVSFYICLLQRDKELMVYYIGTLVVIIFIMVFLMIINRKLKYDKYGKEREEKRLLETDRREKENLIKIEEKTLLRLELNIGRKIYNSINSIEFEKEVIDLLKDIYRLVRGLTKKRKEMLMPLKTSKEKKELINKLGSDINLADISRKYPEFKSIINNLKKITKTISKKRVKEEKINDLIQEFIFNLTKIAADNHLISVIKSEKRIAEVYNGLIDIYMHYKNQFDKRQNTQKEILKIESEFINEIEGISNNPNIMKKVEDNDNLASFYNKLVDLYNSYKRKEELYNEMKQLERNQQEIV